jgi:glycosyltransferase involved in cell wall biosynthesis
MPWRNLPGFIRSIDVSLAPLELNNRFTEAKSELKYFEAGLVEVPTVASDIPSYRFAIRHGHNGFLCSTKDDWFNALETLVLDRSLREGMGKEARQDAVQRYSTRARAPELQTVLAKVFHQHGLCSTRPLSIAFVMRAPIAQTGGGYKNIFALARYLAGRQHDVHLYIEPNSHLVGMSPSEVIEFCHKHFGQSAAKIHVGHRDILASDAVIATNWPTAYTVDSLDNTKCKLYLVQDFEPDFYSKDDPNYESAERSYDLPLKKVALGRYLGALFSERDRLPVPYINFSLDRSLYCNRLRRAERPVRVLFFARPGLKRRAYGVGVDALRRVARACPDVQIAFYGVAEKENLDFDYTNLGKLSPEDVSREMNLSHIHLSFSLTNVSWVPLEAMACGCAVVEAKVPSVELWVGNDDQYCLLSEPEPEKVAAAVIGLVEDPELRSKLAANGEWFVSTISSSWEDTCHEFESELYKSLFKEVAPSEPAAMSASLIDGQMRCP